DMECVPAQSTAVNALYLRGEMSRSLGYLRRLVRVEPDYPALQYMLAETLSDTYAYREARPVLERILRLDPNNSDAYAQLGIGWIDDTSAPDHLQRAEKALRKSIELSPLNSEARLALGRLYLKENQPRA